MNPSKIVELPLRRAPFADESINGFIARIAQLNRFKHAAWVAEAAGVKFPQNFYKDDEVKRLASVTGRPFDELRRIAPTHGRMGPSGLVSVLLGQNMPTKAIVPHTRRFCPACMSSESTHHRIAWSLRFAPACVLHEIRLIDRCAGCRMLLNWRTEAADKCRCGSPLASMSDVAIQTPVDPEELMGPRYLLRALMDGERTTYPLMEGLRFAELLKAVQALGLFGAESNASFKLDDRLTPEVGLWLSRGLRLLTVDPAAFGNQISALTLVGRRGPLKRYVRALWDLEESLVHAGVGNAPLGAALRRLLERYPDGR